MGFDLTVDARVLEWKSRIRSFVDDVVIPREQAAFENGVDDKMRVELQSAAKAADIWAPQLPTSLGGGGFRFDDAAVLLEEAGTSLLGPLAINAAAPDEGNMHMLNVIASAEQRARYLEPLAAGEFRSAFAMTEPPPGAGSDPSALQTTATRTDAGWHIEGHKHFISGARRGRLLHRDGGRRQSRRIRSDNAFGRCGCAGADSRRSHPHDRRRVDRRTPSRICRRGDGGRRCCPGGAR
jgi:acyl-CoA dehydrogenase